ncbi:hypothetical protein ID871_10090 [Streptomyces pratensis]|nr:hypothetical protein [Streptomyces pratensis]
MEAKRLASLRWRTSEVRVTPDPVVKLGTARREVLNHRLAHLEAHSQPLRVCLYSLNLLQERPAPSFAAPRVYASSEGWRICADHRITDPMHRPDWRWVLYLVHAGHIDGVAAPAHTNISPHLDEYELQLALMAHYGGLLAPESAGAKRRVTQSVDAPRLTYGVAAGKERSARHSGAAQRDLSRSARPGGTR